MFKLFGLGKQRTALGKFLDRHNISQLELANWTGLGRNTIARLCNDVEHEAHETTQLKIIGALRRRGYNVSMSKLFRRD